MLFTLLDFISSVSLFIIFTDLLMMFGFHFWWLYAAKTWHYHPKAIQNKYLFKKKNNKGKLHIYICSGCNEHSQYEPCVPPHHHTSC